MARVFVTNHKTVSTEGLIPNYFCFALPRLVIGSENSSHFLYQSFSKLKPIATGSPAFSRAWGRLRVFRLSSYWHFPFVQVVAVITLSLVLRHFIEIHSNQNNGIPDNFWHAIEKNWQALCLSSLFQLPPNRRAKPSRLGMHSWKQTQVWRGSKMLWHHWLQSWGE